MSRKTTKEQKLEVRQSYREKNRERIRKQCRESSKRHREEYNAYKLRKIREALALGLCGRCRKRPREGSKFRCSWCIERCKVLDKQKYRRIKKEAIEHYGGKCVCCGEMHIEFLTIDHPNGDGAKHRARGKRKHKGMEDFHGAGFHIYRYLKKNNYPETFRLLCFNCNCSRGFSGYCPHEREINATRVPTRAQES